MIKNLFNYNISQRRFSNIERAYLEISMVDSATRKVVKIVKLIFLMPYLLIKDLFYLLDKRNIKKISTIGQLSNSNRQIKIGLFCLGTLYSYLHIKNWFQANDFQQIPFYKNNAFLISGSVLVLGVIVASLFDHKRKLLEGSLREDTWGKSLQELADLKSLKIDFNSGDSETEKELCDAISRVKKVDELLKATESPESSSIELVNYDEKLRKDAQGLQDSFTNTLNAIHLTKPIGETLDEGFEKNNWNEVLKIIACLKDIKNSFKFESPDSEKKLRGAIFEVEKAERLLNEIKLPKDCPQSQADYERKLKNDIQDLRDHFTLALNLITAEKESYETYVEVQKKELIESLKKCTDFNSYFEFLQKAKKVTIDIIIGISRGLLSDIDQDIYDSYGNALTSAISIIDKDLQEGGAGTAKERYSEVKCYIEFFVKDLKKLKDNFKFMGDIQDKFLSFNRMVNG